MIGKEQNKSNLNLLIGVSGSVATIKLNQLIEGLLPHYNIKIVATQHALHFLKDEGQLPQNCPTLHFDQEEWDQWKKRTDPVLHIELRKWAHCYLIAPLSANSLAKISNGLADNLLTLVCRCWDMKKMEDKLVNPLIVCPAMNSMMWQHPITEKQLSILREWGYTVMDTEEKKLMCGDFGKGAMLSVQKIIEKVQECTKKIDI